MFPANGNAKVLVNLGTQSIESRMKFLEREKKEQDTYLSAKYQQCDEEDKKRYRAHCF